MCDHFCMYIFSSCTTLISSDLVILNVRWDTKQYEVRKNASFINMEDMYFL